MNTSFSLLNKQFELTRFPEHLQHQSWQAWDAADEYLIEYVEENLEDLSDKSIAIYNDDFGALACWFAPKVTHWVNDSYVSRRGAKNNLAANEIGAEHISFIDCMTTFNTQGNNTGTTPDLILMKVPKTVALLEHQLIQLQNIVTPATQIIAAGKVKAVQKSILALFEKYLGPTTTSLAKKKSRLIFCQPNGNKHHESPYPTQWQLEAINGRPAMSISNHANVFARQQLDIGARLLLQNLPDTHAKTVVDLGCGNGVLGMSVLADSPESKVIFVDESHMAVTSARENVEANFGHRIKDCKFVHSNCLDEFADQGIEQVDLVLCNPPFHQQNAITDHIAWQMFTDAKKYLRRGGELRIIGNRHLDYPQKLKRLFGGYQVVASDRKFSILSSIKR